MNIRCLFLFILILISNNIFVYGIGNSRVHHDYYQNIKKEKEEGYEHCVMCGKKYKENEVIDNNCPNCGRILEPSFTDIKNSIKSFIYDDKEKKNIPNSIEIEDGWRTSGSKPVTPLFAILYLSFIFGFAALCCCDNITFYDKYKITFKDYNIKLNFSLLKILKFIENRL